MGGIRGADLDYVVFFERPFVKLERLILSSLQTFPRSHSVFREAMITVARRQALDQAPDPEAPTGTSLLQLERSEVLVPGNVRRLRLRFAPQLQLIEVFSRYPALTRPASCSGSPWTAMLRREEDNR